MTARALPWIAALAAAGALFLAFPGIDLWASGLFWRPGEGFFLKDWEPVRLVYEGVPYIVEATVAFLLLALLLRLLGRPLKDLDAKAMLFLLAALILAPGLLVNTVLKDHWGRARPVQIVAFGGTRSFTSAPLPAAQCARNCSFVAGHPAMGFYLVSFALLLRRRRARRLAIAAAVGFGALVGVVRIAQGGHFLSDVVFSGLLVCALCRLLHHWIVERDLLVPVLRRAGAAALAPATRGWVAGAALTAVLATLSWLYVDRPLALYIHGQGWDRLAFPQLLTRLGVSTGYLVATGLGFLGLRLAAAMVRGRVLAQRLAAYAWLPLFVFLSVAVSGLLVDILKVVFGRARPRLLFRSDLFGLEWWGMRADWWSLPSGHVTTIVALMAALYCLWPRPRALYILAAVAVSASRVAIDAHYLSDLLVAAYLGLAVTFYLRAVLARSGIDLAEARLGALAPHPALPWRQRLGLGCPRRPPDGAPGSLSDTP